MTNVLSTAVLAVLVYFLLVTIYRLTLHPLAKYPGPLLWKISGWPDALSARSGKRYLIHHRLHRKYGHVVRVGPNSLSYDDPQAFHDVHANRNSNMIKGGFVGLTKAVAESDHLQQIPGKHEHAQRRKVMSYAFTDSALKSAEQFMLVQIRNWCDALGKDAEKSDDGWSSTKDLGHWTNLLTLDVFGQLCFGEDFHATDSGEHKIIDFILMGSIQAQKMAYSPINFLLIPLLRTRWLLKLLSRKMYEDRWSLQIYLESLVSKRAEAETNNEKQSLQTRKDFFHHVLEARDDEGNVLPLKDYVVEALLLTAAGTDTTSTALATCLFYLTRDKARMAKLYQEITSVFKDVNDIHTGPQLSSLTYLRACIDEAMRTLPPVPGSLTRIVLPGGATILSTPIPAGTTIETPMYSTMHNSDIFPHADQFIPERWIPGSKTEFEVTDELVNRQRGAFVPFSLGPRNCLGMRMAYMEMGIVLARLVFLYEMRFDVERMGKGVKEFEVGDWFISTKEGPYLQFRRREGVSS